MQICSDYLSDIPLRKFCALNIDMKGSFSEYVYLFNRPVRGVSPEKSKDKISLGSKGFLRYLNSVSYNVGYVFEVPRAYTSVYPTHILVGSVTSKKDHVGEISTLYLDANIIVLQNKKHSSLMILSQATMNIPEPLILN